MEVWVGEGFGHLDRGGIEYLQEVWREDCGREVD